MGKQTADEMERIRRGLEAYLNDEGEIQMSGTKKEKRSKNTVTGKKVNGSAQSGRSGNHTGNKKYRKRRKKKSGLKKFFMTLLILAAVVIGLWYYGVSHFYSKINFAGNEVQEESNIGNETNDGSGNGNGDGGSQEDFL